MITAWSLTCTSDCTRPALPVAITTVESPHAHKPTNIPPQYAAFADVFSTKKAVQLPHHRLWDCAIELLPGKAPQAHVYSLFREETQAMEEYVVEVL